MADIKLDATNRITSIDTTTQGDSEPSGALRKLLAEQDLRFFVNGNNFQGKLLANGTEKVFIVTGDKTINTGYKLSDISYFTDNRKSTISAYNHNKDSLYADVIVVKIKSSDAMVENGSPVMLVSKISQKISIDGFVRNCLTGYVNDSQVVIVDSDRDVISTVGIKVGDVIKYENNTNNELTSAMILYDSVSHIMTTTSPYYPEDYGNEFHVVNGSIYSKFNNSVSLAQSPSDSTVFSELEFVPLAGASIYLVENNSGNISVKKSQFSEISDYKGFGIDVKAIAYLKHSRTMMFVMYKSER